MRIDNSCRMPLSVYIETHLGGGAIMKRKSVALRNIGIDLDARALGSFVCDYPVELANECCHRFLARFPFDGSELVYSDPPYLHRTRKSARRYRHDYEDHEVLLGLLKRLPSAAMVSGYPSALYEQSSRDDQIVGVVTLMVKVECLPPEALAVPENVYVVPLVRPVIPTLIPEIDTVAPPATV